MKRTAFIAANLLVIAFNVHVSEGATVRPGMYTLQLPCGATEPMVRTLADKYHEKIIYKGKSGEGIMRFYGNPETSTFTVGLEFDRTFCIVMAGQYLMTEVDGTNL